MYDDKSLTLISVIKRVLSDEKATSIEKLERIEMIIEVYENNCKSSMSDMV
jgi:hypothetical protein